MATADTPHGVARVSVDSADGAAGALVLGRGAGGGVAARDLGAAASASRSVGFSVALVEQPYRVAGRRSPGWPGGDHRRRRGSSMRRGWPSFRGCLRVRSLGCRSCAAGAPPAPAWRAGPPASAARSACCAWRFRSTRLGAPPRRGSRSSMPLPCRFWWCRGLRIRSGCLPPRGLGPWWRWQGTTA